jgi:hypothetical protein
MTMDAFSQSVAEELFARFPNWKALSRCESADDGGSFLVVKVPAPAEAHAEHGLVVDTSNQEVTVGFDVYHCHFDGLLGDDNCFGTKSAIHFIDHVLGEQIAVVSWWSGDGWRGSAQLQAGEKPTIPRWSTASDINRMRVRSWHGTLNADVVI